MLLVFQFQFQSGQLHFGLKLDCKMARLLVVSIQYSASADCTSCNRKCNRKCNPGGEMGGGARGTSGGARGRDFPPTRSHKAPRPLPGRGGADRGAGPRLPRPPKNTASELIFKLGPTQWLQKRPTGERSDPPLSGSLGRAVAVAAAGEDIRRAQEPLCRAPCRAGGAPRGAQATDHNALD